MSVSVGDGGGLVDWGPGGKKAKWLSGEGLQIAVKRREAKSKGEKERYKHLNAEFQRRARRDKKWRRLLRVPWTAGRSNQSNLQEISPVLFYCFPLFLFTDH